MEEIIDAQARADAEKKLQRIIDRQGDLNGERRKPWYLEKLVEEAKTAICWELYTTALMELGNEKAPVPTKATEAMSIH